MPGATAVLLTVWSPAKRQATSGQGLSPHAYVVPLDALEQIDLRNERTAVELAQRGAASARAAGLDVVPIVRRTRSGVADAILAVAEEFGARTIVMGSRGLTGVRRMLLGS